ncbi:MAG: AAA family ATPase [Lamprobacter sp.]|uniref:ATP-binding protein n=1 Tax=Lamprobacter sp. TaxID=3100796 RepID=UPI002B25BF00|nr:AAA family ATPase [Lamprobacter sp.]MEA3643180.1 AAA family ATPase [Lamprobacter sp.]
MLRGLAQNPQGRLCLYGPPGTGKSAFAAEVARRLERPLLLAKDPMFSEVFEFNATIITEDLKHLKRYGNRLRKAVHDLVAEQLLPEGLTILDHLELAEPTLRKQFLDTKLLRPILKSTLRRLVCSTPVCLGRSRSHWPPAAWKPSKSRRSGLGTRSARPTRLPPASRKPANG